ncbi:MAG TPA: acetyl-CoA carboxylase biotin carboxyl carrier protein subunit [Lachnospiraceae bacterium]|nr:acetyl-CoA carboxylase biotin carboxyl carrier protein subunit [Lachnospiraceae bacterium]
MKNYTITVNGTAYDVTVEEKGGSTSSKPSPKKKEEKKASKPLGTEGSIKIEAGAAGKVFKLEKHIGDSVKAGETVMILEVMKMETPVVAPQDGIIATIDVQEGQSIEANALLATMNE